MINRRRLLLSAGAVATAPFAPRLRPAAAFPAGPRWRPSPYAGFAHPEWLVEIPWLAAHLTDPALKVIALGSAESFAAARIPGAVGIELGSCKITETSEASVATWRTRVAERLTTLGIEPDDRVIVYDGGDFYAARLWWSLQQIGHTDARMLNGGLPAWRAAGLPIETGAAATPDPAATAHQIVANDAAIATIDETIAAVETGSAIVIDARDAKAYAEGRLPGAVLIPMEANLVADGPPFWTPARELAAVYAGIDKDAPVITYCFAGVRSAATYVALRQLGFQRVALFAGSWAEWSAHPDLPIETGA